MHVTNDSVAPAPDTDRAARARAALALAEQRTGARSLTAELTTVPAPRPDLEGPGQHRAAQTLTDLERPPLPAPPELARLLGDGLRRGGTVAVLGSTSLALALLAPSSTRGSWVGVVGQPSIGLLAAAEAGVVLDRLALVPQPGPDAPGVVAALLDGMDVVLVGPHAALTDADRRRLVARARERGSVLVSTTRWPGAAVVLGVRTLGWTGAGEGDGRLRSLDVRITRSGRGGAGEQVSVELTLPLAPPADDVPTRPTAAPRQPLRLVG